MDLMQMSTAVCGLYVDHNAFRLQRSDFCGCVKPEAARTKPEVMKMSFKIKQLFSKSKSWMK